MSWVCVPLSTNRAHGREDYNEFRKERIGWVLKVLWSIQVTSMVELINLPNGSPAAKWESYLTFSP